MRQDNSVQWVWSNTANYSIELGKNNISAVIGTEAKKENGEHLQGYGRGLVIEDLDYRYLDTVTEGKKCEVTMLPLMLWFLTSVR